MSQYIGARYVPKFYENSNNTSDWTANTVYEALTIVTRNGNSYTSKIPVPASVGAPENNPDYWAATGVYNQQVAQLRTDIDANTAAITALSSAAATKRRYILISDSYGTGVVGTGYANVDGWPVAFKSEGGLANDECYISCADGAGFVGLQSTTFLDLLTAVSATNPDTITDIVIAGGANDGDSAVSTSAVKTAMTSFYNSAKSLYPNARLWLCFCGCSRSTSGNKRAYLRNMMAIYNDDVRYITIAQATYFLQLNTNYAGADTIHLNATGYRALGRWIWGGVWGSTPATYSVDGYATATVTPITDLTISMTTWSYEISGGYLVINNPNGFTLGTSSITITNNTRQKIADIAAPLYGDSGNTCSANVMANFRVAGTWYLGSILVLIKNGEIHIHPSVLTSAGYLDLTGLTSIFIQPGIMAFPLCNLI